MTTGYESMNLPPRRQRNTKQNSERNFQGNSQENFFQFNIKHLGLTTIAAALIATLHIFVLDPLHPSPYRPIIVMAIAGILMMMTGGRIGCITPKKLLLLFFWTGFTTISLVSAILNGDNVIAELWQMVGIPAVIFSAFPVLTGRYGNIIVLIGMVLGFSPYIVASLYQYPLEYPYHGVMDNPNSFGMVAATLLAACYSLLRGLLTYQSKRLQITALVLVIFGLHVLVFASYSRTCSIISVILFLIFTWSLIKDSSRHRTGLVVVMLLIFAAGISCFYILTMTPDSGNSLIVGLFGKNAMKAANEDLLSGRSYVWAMVWKNMQFFGEGVEAMWNKYTFMPHNTYLWILGGKGPLALIFYLAAQLQALYLAYRLAAQKVKQDGFAIGPFMIMMTYVVMGLTESVISVLGDGIQMAFLLMVGVLIHTYDPEISGGSNENTIHS